MQHTVESPCPLSAPPPLISLTLTPSLPPPTLGIPRSRCSTPWSHHVFCPTTYFISCLHPILAPCPTATPSKPPHRDDRASVPCVSHFPSCLHPLLLPRLHSHGSFLLRRPPALNIHCVLPPLNIHMGVPRSRCSTPWNHHALCLPHTL